MKYGTQWMALVFVLGACPLYAAEAGDGDKGVTMTVIEDEGQASEGEFVQDIELPEPAEPDTPPGAEAAGEAHENSAEGRETANEARQQGNEGERGRSQEARENQGRPDEAGNGGMQPPIDLPTEGMQQP